MKVYFLGSLSGIHKYKNIYKKIVSILEQKEHKVYCDHILNVDPENVTTLDEDARKKYFSKMRRTILQSDFVVAEVSHPTPNIGYEIAFAVENEKPILVLHDEKSNVFPILLGNSSDKIVIKTYNSGDLEKVISKGIKALKAKMDIRFNFFISSEIVRYLDWIAKVKRVPRSVYLRDLIEDDMKKHKEYSTQV